MPLTLSPRLRTAKRAMLRLLPRYREYAELMARQLGDPDRGVVALSRMVARDYQRCYGIRAEQIRLIYNGVPYAVKK